MSRPRVALTRRWPDAVENALADRFELLLPDEDRGLDVAQLQALIADVDALCPTVTDRVDARVLAAAGPRLRIIGNYGVGFEHIDLDAARARQLCVTNTPDVLTEATADLTMALILSLARRVIEGDTWVRRGQWPGWCPTQMLGTQVSGKTLGLVGYGRIARAVAVRAHRGFGMNIQVFSPRLDSRSAGPLPIEICPSLEAVLEQADFVSLHCPSRADTRHLIGSARLRSMQRHAFLINTARGNIVDESALVEALVQGVIAGAGLDVYEREPQLAAGLAGLSNVVLLPHLGSATRETRIAMGMRVLRNLEEFFAGRPPPDRIA